MVIIGDENIPEFVQVCPNCKKLVQKQTCTKCLIKPVKIDIDNLEEFL